MDRTLFHPSSDEGVISTNDDASGCKRHAVRIGYWKDDYIGSFVKDTDRKAPEISRGYYARVKGVEISIEKFLEVNGCVEYRRLDRERKGEEKHTAAVQLYITLALSSVLFGCTLLHKLLLLLFGIQFP